MPENNKNKDIELRSEKVRNIVGKIPPLLLRMGISVISVIIVLVLTLVYLIPYSEYKDITVCLYNNAAIPDSISEIYGVCTIPSNEIGRIKEGQKVSVTIADKDTRFKGRSFLLNGYVRNINFFADLNNAGQTFYKVEIAGFPDSLRKCEDNYFLLPHKPYNGKILLSDKPVLQKIIKSAILPRQ